MLIRENSIIIGSTGRNTGKTEFSCQLIKKYSKQFFITGVKVVCIDRNEGSCPRGGKGCGVCTSLKGTFEIREENVINPDKDTSRMLMHGAQKVYLLKVDQNHLETGINELLKIISQDSFIVFESNSIRKVVQPGLFIVIKNLEDHSIKSSCAEVVQYADKIIEFNNFNWNFSPDRIVIKDNKWTIKEKATAIVLSGGKSSRMNGEDKSLLPVNGIPMIQYIIRQLEGHFDEIIIGSNFPEKYSFLNYHVVTDIEPDKGPLMGILSCLKQSSNEINFVIACDIPVINTKLIHNMINLSYGTEIVMPLRGTDKHEPLYAVYRKSIADYADKIIKDGGRKIIELFKYASYRFVDFNDASWYQNLNFRENYLDFIKLNENRQCYRDAEERDN